MSSEGFTLRDIGLMLTRRPSGTSPKRLGEAIRRDSYALVNYNRVKMMLERLGCCACSTRRRADSITRRAYGYVTVSCQTEGPILCTGYDWSTRRKTT